MQANCKQVSLLSCFSESQKSEVKVSAGKHFFWRPWGTNPFPYFFSFQKLPTFLGPWPLSLNHSNLLLLSLFSTTLIYLPPSYKSSYDYSGPTQPIQHNLCSLSPYLHMSVKSFNHARQHVYRFWGPGGKALREGHHAYDLPSPVFKPCPLTASSTHIYKGCSVCLWKGQPGQGFTEVLQEAWTSWIG